MKSNRILFSALLMLLLVAGFACTVDTGNNGGTDADADADADTDADTDADGDSDIDTSVQSGLCAATGGSWRTDWCGSHWPCGLTPDCPDDGSSGEPEFLNTEGCDCGAGKMFDEAKGCEDNALCTALECANLAPLDASWGHYDGNGWLNGCTYQDLGWAVFDDVCTLVRGCAENIAPFPLFPTQDACHNGCDTRQELCMTTGGVWMLEPACDNYVCGVDADDSCAGEDRKIVCSCGPSMNWVDGVGCETDTDCPPPGGSGSCPTLDFGDTDDYLASCPIMPVVHHYGLVNGEPCKTIFGCPADFDPVSGTVDPNDWFDNEQDCLNACAGCTSNADCPVDGDTDTENDQFCQFPQATNCGAWGAGTCVAPAEICSYVFDPVCGCDGENIGNLCAVGFQRSLAYDGECFDFPTP